MSTASQRGLWEGFPSVSCWSFKGFQHQWKCNKMHVFALCPITYLKCIVLTCAGAERPVSSVWCEKAASHGPFIFVGLLRCSVHKATEASCGSEHYKRESVFVLLLFLFLILKVLKCLKSFSFRWFLFLCFIEYQCFSLRFLFVLRERGNYLLFWLKFIYMTGEFYFKCLDQTVNCTDSVEIITKE